MAPLALTPEISAWVVEAYLRGETRGAIAARVGVHPNTVTRVVQRAGIDSRSGRRRRLDPPAEAGLVADYAAGVPTREIAARVGVSAQYVSRLAIGAGVAPRRPRPAMSVRMPDEASIAAIIDGYRAGASTRELARVHGRSRATVLRYLDRAGVPRRPAHAR